ncbi:MAG: 5-formyltetrahydrofolate cyclo-ligase [Kiloniellales bacterium]
MSADLAEEKAALRKRARATRSAAAKRALGAASAFLEQLDSGPEIPAAASISAFWPMGSEIDVAPAIEALHERGHAIALPVMLGPAQPLIFRLWTPATVLEAADFGTSEPPANAPEIEPQVLIVPLLAFDRQGYRLGYGGGFYDRTLAKLRAKGSVLSIGAAYAAQEVDSVPREATDLALDWVVTEREAIRIA